MPESPTPDARFIASNEPIVGAVVLERGEDDQWSIYARCPEDDVAEAIAAALNAPASDSGEREALLQRVIDAAYSSAQEFEQDPQTALTCVIEQLERVVSDPAPSSPTAGIETGIEKPAPAGGEGAFGPDAMPLGAPDDPAPAGGEGQDTPAREHGRRWTITVCPICAALLQRVRPSDQGERGVGCMDLDGDGHPWAWGVDIEVVPAASSLPVQDGEGWARELAEVVRDGEALRERLTFAFAANRLRRPITEVHPDELTTADGSKAAVALDAIQHYGVDVPAREATRFERWLGRPNARCEWQEVVGPDALGSARAFGWELRRAGWVDVPETER